MWRQKSKSLWLKEGDQNTKFFHSKASHRKRKNNITRLKDGNGVWTENTDIMNVITQHFNNLFSAPDHCVHADFLETLSGLVTEEINQDLTREFTNQEIKEALHQRHPSKAPKPDSMSPHFYQKYWHIMGSTISDAVLNVLNTSIFPHALNHTHIVFFPKKSPLTKQVIFDLLAYVMYFIRLFPRS